MPTGRERGGKYGTDQRFQGDRGFAGQKRSSVRPGSSGRGVDAPAQWGSGNGQLILRDLVNATIGFEVLAGDLHKPSKSLHRMLSRAGNPTMQNLSAILVAIKKALRVDIRAVVSPDGGLTPEPGQTCITTPVSFSLQP